MQSLEIISINIWQILISLCNLLLLFLILKKFLYKPVKKVLAERKNALDSQYSHASEAENDALSMKKQWEDKLSNADSQANEVIKAALDNAKIQSDELLAKSKEQADRIILKAQADAKLEFKKAQSEIKKEIVDVSTALSEKMIGREINAEDHRDLIDAFISEIGDNNDADE